MLRTGLLCALVTCVAVASAGLGAGCSGARGEPIRLAWVGPLSGPGSEDARGSVRGIELLLDQLNQAGGVNGRPLALDLHDSRGEAARSLELASEIAASGAVAVIGQENSTASLAAGRVYAEQGLPAIAISATSVRVTQGNPWFFRVIYNDRDQGRLVTAYLARVLEAERYGMVHETTAYGAYLAMVSQEASSEVGLELARRWPVDPASPDLEARIDEIADALTAPTGPQVLLIATHLDVGAPLVRALRERDYEGELVVTDALASPALPAAFRDLPEERLRPGFYTDGIYASTPFLFDLGAERAGEFLNAFVGRHGRNPEWHAALGADAASLVVEALRRASLAPKPGTLADDRRALRDALAAIDRRRPADGVTGRLWFDENGDTDRPVPIGRFLNGEIASASQQLRLLRAIDVGDLEASLDPRRVVDLGDLLLYRVDVAQVGARAIGFRDIDFRKGSFRIEFDIWFRHAGTREVEQVVFTNALEPVLLGPPVDQVLDGPLQYRRYRTEGLFRADTIGTSYGSHSLAISFHHRERTSDDLVLAADPIGMNLGQSAADREEVFSRAQQLLGPRSPFQLDRQVFFERDVEESALGDPRYLAGDTPTRRFSELTLGLVLTRAPSGLRGVVPEDLQAGAFGMAVVGSLLLLLVRPAEPSRLRFALQALFLVLGLIVAEPVLGARLAEFSTPMQLEQLRRTFDILWWVVPAFLANLAIRRFLWHRTEHLTGQPVPTLLRYFVSTIIYTLAFFGVVAFVYDYTLTGLLATSGVLAMIFGLAIQLNITNLFAGVAINLERPFRVGDWIMIHGRTPEPENSVIGMVIDINWRTTRLRTADDTEIVIPNGQISEKTITNFMAPSEVSRFELFFTVDQSVPPDKVIQLMQEAIMAVTGAENKGPLADPKPSVRINATSENGIEYIVRYRLIPREVSPLKARHTINEAVIRALREAGIELAYHKRRVQEVPAPEGAS